MFWLEPYVTCFQTFVQSSALTMITLMRKKIKRNTCIQETSLAYVGFGSNIILIAFGVDIYALSVLPHTYEHPLHHQEHLSVKLCKS